MKTWKLLLDLLQRKKGSLTFTRVTGKALTFVLSDWLLLTFDDCVGEQNQLSFANFVAMPGMIYWLLSTGQVITTDFYCQL